MFSLQVSDCHFVIAMPACEAGAKMAAPSAITAERMTKRLIIQFSSVYALTYRRPCVAPVHSPVTTVATRGDRIKSHICSNTGFSEKVRIRDKGACDTER